MDNYEIIQRLEHASDLRNNPSRLKDYIEMGQNIFLSDKDYEEGKRVCLTGRDIALKQAYFNPQFYDIYLTVLTIRSQSKAE